MGGLQRRIDMRATIKSQSTNSNAPLQNWHLGNHTGKRTLNSWFQLRSWEEDSVS